MISCKLASVSMSHVLLAGKVGLAGISNVLRASKDLDLIS